MKTQKREALETAGWVAGNAEDFLELTDPTIPRGSNMMATRDQVRALITSRPFRPFTVRTNSGETYTIYHPELISCSVDGRDMQVNDDDGLHLLDMACVEALDPVPAPKPSAPQT